KLELDIFQQPGFRTLHFFLAGWLPHDVVDSVENDLAGLFDRILLAKKRAENRGARLVQLQIESHGLVRLLVGDERLRQPTGGIVTEEADKNIDRWIIRV